MGDYNTIRRDGTLSTVGVLTGSADLFGEDIKIDMIIDAVMICLDGLQTERTAGLCAVDFRNRPGLGWEKEEEPPNKCFLK